MRWVDALKAGIPMQSWVDVAIVGLLIVNLAITGYVAYSLLWSEITCWPPESYLEMLRESKQGGGGLPKQ